MGRTDAEYEAMSAAVEAGDWKATSAPVPGPGYASLKRGRPAGRREARGATPNTSVRLPADLRRRLDERAAAEGIKQAEIIRRALAAYLDAAV